MLRLAVACVAVAVLAAGCSDLVLPDQNATRPATSPLPSSATGDSPPGATGQPGQPMASPGAPSGSSTTTTASAGTGVSYSIPRSVHEAAWLCQTAVAVDDLTQPSAADLACKVELSFTDTTVTVKSTGIPNHDYESGGACCAKTQTYTNTFPLKPEMAKSVTFAPTRGQTGLAVNGASIYGPEDADSQDVVAATYNDPDAQPRLNLCDGHSDPGGIYHYHADGNCIHVHPAGGDWSTYSFDGSVDKGSHGKIMAFMPDGFPVYGSYGWDDDGVTVKEMTSSYRLKSGKTGSGGIADYEYVAGLGDLDECNGRLSATPDFAEPVYHYYTTKHNGEGAYGFPYFPHCYKGVVSSGASTGLQGGGGSGSGGMQGGQGGAGQSGTQSGQPPPPGGSQTGSGSGQPPPSGSQSGTGSCPPPPPPGSPPPSSPPPPGCGPPGGGG